MEANAKIPVFTKGLRSRPLTFIIMNIVNSDSVDKPFFPTPFQNIAVSVEPTCF